MKKLILLVAIIMIFLVGCSKENNEVNTNNEISSVTENVSHEEYDDSNTKSFFMNKNYYYLISNELLATTNNGIVKSKEESVLKLNDILVDEGYYEYTNIFSGNENIKHDDINVCAYYSDGLKVNETSFDKIIGMMNSGDLVSVKEKENDNWFDSRDIYSYKLNNIISQSGEVDIKDELKVYGGSIDFGNNFVTNNDMLEFVVPNYSSDISQKATEFVEKFISEYKLDVPSYEVKNYSIDIDKDSVDENFYIVENPIKRNDNGYFDGEEQFTESNKIFLCFIEDGDYIVSLRSHYMPKYASKEEFSNKYWDDDSMFYGNPKVTFADFNGDDDLEILLLSEAIAIEPFDVYELIDYSDSNMKVVAMLEGPNH